MINVDSLEWRKTQEFIESQVQAAIDDLIHERDPITAAELRGVIAALRGVIEHVTNPLPQWQASNSYQT
jgi:hypothetical protein